MKKGGEVTKVDCGEVRGFEKGREEGERETATKERRGRRGRGKGKGLGFGEIYILLIPIHIPPVAEGLVRRRGGEERCCVGEGSGCVSERVRESVWSARCKREREEER